MLQVRGLRKSYSGTEVVRGVSFSVAAGECYGLLGPNGAGKTTTLRCCLGLTASDAGTLTLAGYPVPAQARAARTRAGVCPQFDNLDPDFTVAENLVVYGSYFGIPRRTVQQRVPQLLEFAGLEDKATAALATLSGGMKRRLTLARGADLARGLTLGLPVAHPWLDVLVLCAYAAGGVWVAVRLIRRRLLT